MLTVNLRDYFTPDSIIRSLELLPPVHSQILDTVYPVRRNHPLPVIAVSDLSQPVKNIAVTRRGSGPTPVFGESSSISYIEPQPIKPSERLGAVDMNNLKTLSGEGIRQLMDNKIDRLRRIVRASTEALAAQSLTGSISYPMQMDGGLGTYDVSFGSTLSYTPATLWDAAGAAADKVMGDMIEMESRIREQSGYGAQLKFLAGKKAFLSLCKVVQDISAKSSIVANISDRAVNIAGYTVELANGSYTDLATGNMVKTVAENKIVAIALDAPFETVYTALDDLEAGLVAMPFFVKPVEDQRSSTIELIAESKPLPVPFTKGICWATVTA